MHLLVIRRMSTACLQPKPREKVIDTLLKYVETDATCCRVEDPKVAAKQAQVCTRNCTSSPRHIPIAGLLIAHGLCIDWEIGLL